MMNAETTADHVQNIMGHLVDTSTPVMHGITDPLVQVAVVVVLQHGLMTQQMNHHVMERYALQEKHAQEVLVYL